MNRLSAAPGFLNNGITAHRGDSHNAPENTLTAFREGLASGADWIELDVASTLDGHLVVNHDETTGRTGDADMKIASSSLAALRKIDMAHAFRQKNGNRSIPKEKIPLLEEVLDLVLSQNRCRVSIQPKSPCLDAVIDLLESKKALDFAGINEAAFHIMEEARRRTDRLTLFWDRPAGTSVEDDIKKAAGLSISAMVLERSDITRERITRIQQAGFQAGAWIVNDPEQMRCFLSWGIDRIYTDRPLDLVSVKMPSPSQNTFVSL